MKLLKCILTENDCFKAGRTIVPRGVMIHSTGANNPMLRRYVQPGKEDADRAKLMGQLGDNPYDNDWNKGGLNVCVHGFIGRLADGKVAAVQTLPWTCRGWHAGRGRNGSANDSHISFEICEDGLSDPVYFREVYDTAVGLTAHLCTLYRLDPAQPGVIICHSEGYRLGVASNHGDVEHWFPKMGKSMEEFRSDVAEAMKPEEGRTMTQEQFDHMMERWLAKQAELEASDWSAKERAWVETMGLIRGDTEGRKGYKAPCTREEVAVLIYRLEHPGE